MISLSWLLTLLQLGSGKHKQLNTPVRDFLNGSFEVGQLILNLTHYGGSSHTHTRKKKVCAFAMVAFILVGKLIYSILGMFLL